jgi:hypothetical protein
VFIALIVAISDEIAYYEIPFYRANSAHWVTAAVF